MTISVGNILRVVAVLNWLDGDIAQNVFNAEITGGGGPFDEDDIVDDALDWVETIFDNLVASMTDEIDGSEIRVYVYDTVGDDWDEIGSAAWVFNPGGVGEQLPRGVAELINVKTTDPDVNGKKYVMGVTEDVIDDGLMSVGELGRMALYADDWVTPFVGAVSVADWTPGVWSTVQTDCLAMSGTVIIPSILAYQRRRKRGVGI